MALTRYKRVSNYKEAWELLGSRDRLKLANNTYLIKHPDFIAVRYHDTDIVRYYPRFAVLTSGGYHTYTTKERLNIYAPCYVYQEDWDWYVTSKYPSERKGKEFDRPFVDNMKVSYYYGEEI